jgi:hypothetical protein
MVGCAIVSLGVGVGWQVAAAATGGSTGAVSQAKASSSSAAVVTDAAQGATPAWNNGGGGNQSCSKPKNEGPSGCWPAGITTSSSNCQNGKNITVTGNNFVPNEQITLTLETSPPVSYSGVKSDSNGSFSISIKVSALKTGTYVLKATDGAGDSTSTDIKVT